MEKKEMKKNREKIREWFETEKPSFSINGLLIGAALMAITYFFIGFSTVGWIVFILGIIITGGVFLIYYTLEDEYKKRISDEQIDKWLSEDIQKHIDVAVNKLGLDSSDLIANSLIVQGPIYWNVSGFSEDDILRNLGKDSFYRYSIWRLQVFVFTENFLGNYQCDYNWLNDTSINESTNEFFYKDVVSVKTDSDSTAYNLVDGVKIEHAQAFQLNLPGDSVKVIVNHNNLKVSNFVTNQIDTAVQGIRKMIRQKKI